LDQQADILLNLVLIKQEKEEDFRELPAKEANHSSDLKQATKEGALPEED
jgi:hypothetical protein